MSQWKFAQPAAEKAGFVVPSAWVSSPQRRILDMCVAGTALVICLPLFLVIAVAVRCSSTGPAIFRQRRMGRNGQEFMWLSVKRAKVEMLGDRQPLPLTSQWRQLDIISNRLK